MISFSELFGEDFISRNYLVKGFISQNNLVKAQKLAISLSRATRLKPESW